MKGQTILVAVFIGLLLISFTSAAAVKKPVVIIPVKNVSQLNNGSNLVPYTGATRDVNLSNRNLITDGWLKSTWEIIAGTMVLSSGSISDSTGSISFNYDDVGTKASVESKGYKLVEGTWIVGGVDVSDKINGKYFQYIHNPNAYIRNSDNFPAGGGSSTMINQFWNGSYYLKLYYYRDGAVEFEGSLASFDETDSGEYEGYKTYSADVSSPTAEVYDGLSHYVSPYQTSSTTLNTNLNADLWDGYHTSNVTLGNVIVTNLTVQGSRGLTGNYTNGNCWNKFTEGILVSTNCTLA